jgi:hypothetical protein
LPAVALAATAQGNRGLAKTLGLTIPETLLATTFRRPIIALATRYIAYRRSMGYATSSLTAALSPMATTSLGTIEVRRSMWIAFFAATYRCNRQ